MDLTRISLSRSSKSMKLLLSPMRLLSVLMILRPSEWNVVTMSPSAASGETLRNTLSFISRAALLVKVTAATE